MGRHGNSAKRHKHDGSGNNAQIKQARMKIIQGRKSLNAQEAFEGFQLLAEQSEVPIPVDLVDTVLSVFVESQAPTSAQQQEEMKSQVGEIYTKTREAHKDTPHKIDEAFYSSSMRVLLRLDDYDGALKICNDMVAAGHEIRHRSYTPLLAKTCEMGDLDQAKTYYAEMRKANMVTDVNSIAMLRALKPEHRDFAVQVLKDCENRAMDVPSHELTEAAFKALGAAETVEYHKLDPSNNACSCCKQELRSIDVPAEVVQNLLKETSNLAPTQDEKKKKEWEVFLNWEAKNLQEYDCIVDGANMAYFRSSAPNSDHDEPKYEHADVMMEELVRVGRKPLLFFHARHFKHNGGIPKPIVAKWKPKTYVVPHGHNDDIFWLHFALKLSLDKQSAWMITNDQMRDHKFEMINTSGHFTRWRERHQVAYDFIWDHKTKAILPGLFPPLPYSVQLQQVGDKWHFPKQVPFTSEEAKLLEEKEALKKLSQPDLRQQLAQRKITFDLFRQVRAEVSGCEKPKTLGKSYVWACV